MFCQFMLHSKVTQSYINIHSLSHIILHHVPSQVTRSSSLCYTAGAHCLSIPNAIVCQNPSPSHSFPLKTTNQFSMSMSLFLFCRKVHLCHILDSRYKRYHMVFIFLTWCWTSIFAPLVSLALYLGRLASVDCFTKSLAFCFH